MGAGRELVSIWDLRRRSKDIDAMISQIKSPFTQEQVDALNEYQKVREFHPFTCGGDRTDKYHLDGEGVLVATIEGWKCPYCPYTQDWAYEFMTSSNPRKTFIDLEERWKKRRRE